MNHKCIKNTSRMNLRRIKNQLPEEIHHDGLRDGSDDCTERNEYCENYLDTFNCMLNFCIKETLPY